MKKITICCVLLLLASCEKTDKCDSLHPVNTRSDSLNLKPGADIYIEVDTVLNEYDVDLTIKRHKQSKD